MTYFTLKEFACKCGCGYDGISPELTGKLDLAREEAGVPFVVTSGCRCQKHNSQVGGVKNSAHTTGMAADIAAPPDRMYVILKALMQHFNRVGISFKGNFIHVDVDKSKTAKTVWEY